MKKTTRRSKQRSVSDSPSPSTSKENHEEVKRVRELEIENEALKREIKELRHKAFNVSSTSDVDDQNMMEDYYERSNNQVVELKKKLDILSQLSAKKLKTVGATNDFQDEIHSLKTQKVQLQCKLKLESLQFRLCKSAMEREILQLKKEQRRNKCKMQMLLALNQKQKHVMQRKMEEALVVRKKLKDVLESKKAASCKIAGAKHTQTSKIQGVKHGFDMKAQPPKVGIEYERQMQKMIDEIRKLELESERIREETPRSMLQDDEASVTESELSDLKEEMSRLSCLISQMNLSKPKVIQMDKPQVSAAQASASGHEVDAAQSSLSPGSDVFVSATDASEPENSEGVKDKPEKPASGVCCSCSKKSLCKTLKCGCRAVGGSCGASCGCATAKCTNRDQLKIRFGDSPQSEMAENILNGSSNPEELKSTIFQDTKLPKPKIGKKNTVSDEDSELKRQPLRDTGNITIKPDAGKPGKTRKAQKKVISA